MRTNKELIESLDKKTEYLKRFPRGKKIMYYDPDKDKFEVDYSKLRKEEDNSNFVSYVKATLKGTSVLNKIEDISGAGYSVFIKGGPDIHDSDIRVIRNRLRNKASVIVDDSAKEGFSVEIIITFNKESKEK